MFFASRIGNDRIGGPYDSLKNCRSVVQLPLVPLKCYVMDNYKVEGNMLFQDKKTMLTWGPFYYHSKEKAIERISDIFNDIMNWVNLKDPSLNIQATNIVESRSRTQKVFNCKAWKTDDLLEDVGCIIRVDPIFFVDE